MDTLQAYNLWATQYGTNPNQTRDMEAIALRESLAGISFDNCLGIGCGTGKNTIWLVEKAAMLTAVDLSDEMLSKARVKITSPKVKFIQADITRPWTFTNEAFRLVTFSLVLEHISDLDHIFAGTAKLLEPGGFVYIGEFHPFKQYNGSKARFETEQGTQVVDCFNHHVSDFTDKPKNYGLQVISVNEYFDENDRNNIPRILTVLLKKV